MQLKGQHSIRFVRRGPLSVPLGRQDGQFGQKVPRARGESERCRDEPR